MNRLLNAEWTNGIDVDYCDHCGHPFHKYRDEQG